MKPAQVIITKVDDMPLIYHWGILVDIDGGSFVVHNPLRGSNRYGGSVIIEPLNDFIKSRSIIHVRPMDISSDHVIKKSFEHAGRPFDIYSWNCEQFIRAVEEKPPILPTYITIILSIILINNLFTIKKSKS